MTCPTCGAPKYRAVCAEWCWTADPTRPDLGGNILVGSHYKRLIGEPLRAPHELARASELP